LQPVLDVRVREGSPVEEVCCRDADRVAGPHKEVLMPARYVKDLVGDVPEEVKIPGWR
jgi:hypothetical protein